MKYQFNKTELQRMQKNLKMRLSALPILKNKESALRAEIKKYKDGLKDTEVLFQQEDDRVSASKALFGEFSHPVRLKSVATSQHKIAGVQIPMLEAVEFEIPALALFSAPSWLLDGIEMTKTVASLKIKLKIAHRQISILEIARKKTTQKVNLYEKVQIPEFEAAIIKIKRFLEDADNLDRASQKIVKKKKVAIL